MRGPWLGRTLVALAAAKILTGIFGFIIGEPPGSVPRAVPPTVNIAVMLTFAVTGGGLLLGGRGDRRARRLGIAFILAATPFADLSINFLPRSFPGLAWLAATFRHVRLDAFLPYFWWLFIADFPRVVTFGWPVRMLRVLQGTSFGVGAVLFALHFLFLAQESLALPTSVWDALGWLYRSRGNSLYWVALFTLVAPTLPIGWWRARRARIDERRRVSMVMAGLVVGSSPILIGVVLLSLPGGVGEWLRSPAGTRLSGLLIYPALLTIPLSAAYAVIVHRALDVRLVVRKALRYSLTRYALLGVAAVPFTAMVVLLYRSRDQTLTQLLSAPEGAFLLGAVLLSLAALAMRTRARDELDRRFFREQYDARRILGDLVEQSQSVQSGPELARLLSDEIDRALHLVSAHVLLADGGGWLRSPPGDIRPLERTSALGRLARQRRAPFEVDLETPEPDLQSLPGESHQWLADAGCRLMVPLLDPRGSLSAMIVLGEKRSELPFSSEDRALLSALAGAASRTLADIHESFPVDAITGEAKLRTRDSASPADDQGVFAAEGVEEDPRATECVSCGLVQASDVTACGRCSHALIRATLPPVMFGKYRLTERIGRGGMGVVYKALDLTLGRDVAIKTLPRVSPTESLQLRREARAVAAVSHPNLATIYAAESWLGIPILVFEYLAGGDLAKRVAAGPLVVDEAIQLGMTLADVADAIHEAGILHRDIKPSNVGFTLGGVPKLLDFGVATLPGAARVESGASAVESGERGQLAAPGAESERLVGTLPYLSPEAVNGRAPDPGFDLWSIALVVYEAIAGQNPMVAGSPLMTVLRISEADVADIRTVRPDCPPSVAEFFRRALAADPRRRPASGSELRRLLADLISAQAA